MGCGALPVWCSTAPANGRVAGPRSLTGCRVLAHAVWAGSRFDAVVVGFVLRAGLTVAALTAWMEALVGWFADLLSSVVSDTKAYLVKKQTMTLAERMAEAEAEAEVEEAEEEDEGSDEEVKAIYNPKNLPLGWDGKPIPYWLYKVCCQCAGEGPLHCPSTRTCTP